jgi:hypothetical protein
MISGVLDGVHGLDISWCRCPPYSTSKTVGWVSENFVAYERCCQWITSVLAYIPDANQYTDLATDPHIWKKKDYVLWLSNRALDSTGLLKDVKSRVLSYYNKDATSLPLIVAARGCNTKVVLDMIEAKRMLISSLMTLLSNEMKHKNYEVIVRNFLTCYHQFDEAMNQKKLPSYLSHYNFISLLNMTQQLYDYGSMRLLWEGGQMGEGFIRGIKTELKIGLLKRWQKWAIDNILIDKVY